MSETLSTLGLKLLAQRLIKERDLITVQIANGHCKSFDEYRYMAGRVRALSDILDPENGWMKDTEKELYEGPK